MKQYVGGQSGPAGTVPRRSHRSVAAVMLHEV